MRTTILLHVLALAITLGGTTPAWWWWMPCDATPAVRGPAVALHAGPDGDAQWCTVVAQGQGPVWVEGEQVRWVVWLPGVSK